VINACRSALSGADPSNNATDPWGITRAFLEGGVSAVVGTYRDISDEAGCAFSTTLYQELVQGKAVDTAVAEARRSVDALSVNQQADPRDWSAFALHLQEWPEVVLPRCSWVPFVDPADVPEYSSERVRRFVNRKQERRLLADRLRSLRDPRRSSLTIVHGDKDFGKTTLMLCASKRQP